MIRLEKPFNKDSRRKKIVFLHGFLGDADEFKHIGRVLDRTCDVGYATLSCQRRLLSRAGWHPEQNLGITREAIHLVGYSMGGRIALQIACRFPHLVRRLTLISASPGIACAKERRARLLHDRALAQQLRRVGMREFLSFWYRQPLFRDFSTHPDFYHIVQRRMMHDPFEQAAILEGLSTGALPPLWDAIPRLAMPIELICGERDPKFCDIGHQMAALNSRIQVTIVPNAGHVVHWEASDMVTELLYRAICVYDASDGHEAASDCTEKHCC